MKNYITNFWNHKFLLWELVKKGIKLKYRKSYLGIIWSLLEPILTTCVLTVVFGTLFGNNDRSFPLYILCGRLLYSFFSLGTKTAARSIRTNAVMIKKIYVPKYIYPLSCVIYNYIIFLISLLVLILLSIYSQVAPTWNTFYIIIPLFQLFILTYGVGIILSVATVFFRDMEYLWDVVLMIIMYTCSIFYYPERLIKSNFGWILKYNPLYGIIQTFRDSIFGNPINWKLVIYAGIFSISAFVFGHFIFFLKQDKFILKV